MIILDQNELYHEKDSRDDNGPHQITVADKSPMLCQILSNSHKHKSDRETVIGPFKYRHISIKEFREVRNVLTQVIIIGGQATECIQHNAYNDHRAELKPAGQIPHQHDTQQAGHEKP